MAGRFFNEPITVDGVRFASKAEARRYQELKILLQAGRIADLTLHPQWPLRVNDVYVGQYSADFQYREEGRTVVEDVKPLGGPVSRDYPLRVKLLKALYGIEVVEIRY